MPEAEAVSSDDVKKSDEVDKLRRASSIVGLLPLGVFVVVHLLVQASALFGSEAHARTIEATRRIPLAGPFLALFVVVPLLFHGLWGLREMIKGNHGTVLGGKKNPLVVLDRGAAIVLLGFVGWHLFRLGPGWFRNTPGTEGRIHSQLVETLSATSAGVPWPAMIMLVGVAATAVHLAVGLVAYRKRNSLDVLPREVRRTRRWMMLAGAALFALGTATVLAFATGMQLGSYDSRAALPCGSAATSPTSSSAPASSTR